MPRGGTLPPKMGIGGKTLLMMIVVMLIVVYAILFSTDCRAAESDSLYYVSATDMMAQVDSVIGVCDTTRLSPEEYADAVWDLNVKPEDLPRSPTIITYRELIDVEVVQELVTKNLPTGTYGMGWPINAEVVYDTLHYHPGGIYVVSPGQMVVWWKEVKK